MLYETLLLIGSVGLAAQAVLGMTVHSGHGHDGNGHGIDIHSGHGHMTAAGHHSDLAHAPVAYGEAHAAGHSQGEHALHQRAAFSPWTLFSPLTIFSLCLGAGASGILTRTYLKMPFLVALAAAVGGLLFYIGIVRPLWSLIFKFASKPAETLSGVVAREAEAMGNFNAAGQGIVRVTVDGQYVRLLAHLEPEDRERGTVVSSGDKLVVTGVDEKRNTCRVTRL